MTLCLETDSTHKKQKQMSFFSNKTSFFVIIISKPKITHPNMLEHGRVISFPPGPLREDRV